MLSIQMGSILHMLCLVLIDITNVAVRECFAVLLFAPRKGSASKSETFIQSFLGSRVEREQEMRPRSQRASISNELTRGGKYAKVTLCSFQRMKRTERGSVLCLDLNTLFNMLQQFCGIPERSKTSRTKQRHNTSNV